jgi:uncharacterized LabA/DUF88 family protein
MTQATASALRSLVVSGTGAPDARLEDGAVVPSYAALFVDFENVYYHLKNQESGRDPGDRVVQLIRGLREELQRRYEERVIINHAYADFEKIDEVQGQLYLSGVETHHVLGSEHKNAADMKLCIDSMETLYTRQEITTFVFVAGDRDYIPVIQHLKKHARTVRVVSFRETLSGDLLTIVGEDYFIDAASMLPPTATRVVRPERPSAPPPRPAAPLPSTPGAADPGDPRRAIRVMMKYFEGKPEIWLTPYLYKLSAEMPTLAEHQRRELIDYLAETGAIRVEKRKGEPYDYSVILINWNHPEVRAAAIEG